MMRIAQSGRLGLTSAVMLSWLLARPAGTPAQEGSPPVGPAPMVTLSADTYQALLDRLQKLEQRTDQLAKPPADLARETTTSAGQAQEGLGSGLGAQPRGGGSDRASPGTAGGGSKASGGGDPTTIGRAQEVGNLHLGQVPLN